MREAGKQIDIQTDRQTDGQTEKESGRGRERERERERKREKEREKIEDQHHSFGVRSTGRNNIPRGRLSKFTSFLSPLLINCL